VTHSHLFIIGGFIFIKTSGTSLANLHCYPKFDVVAYTSFFLQRLNQYFTTDQYPSRAVKESLAQELGLTFRQVRMSLS